MIIKDMNKTNEDNDNGSISKEDTDDDEMNDFLGSLKVTES